MISAQSGEAAEEGGPAGYGEGDPLPLREAFRHLGVHHEGPEDARRRQGHGAHTGPDVFAKLK